MGPEATILFWWLMFGGTHLLGSSGAVRPRLIGALGIRGFKGLYTLVAFATFIPLCVVFGTNKHMGAVLFNPGPPVTLLAQVLMLVAFLFLVPGSMTPNPMTTSAEMSGEFPNAAQGIQRITRHPAAAGFVLFGLAHCLVNPAVGDLLFFGGFVVYSCLAAAHQDRRTLASGQEEIRQFQAETSLIPFGAILSGKQTLVLGEFRTVPLVVALVLFLGLRLLHGSIFGGFAT